MTGGFIVDAHQHTGAMSMFFTPESETRSLLARMDRLEVRWGINTGSWRTLMLGGREALEEARGDFEGSEGRLFYLGAYDPRRGDAALRLLRESLRWPGFAGIKIHPSFHRTAAEDGRYEAAWRLAAETGLTIMSHSWSVSATNPVQALSTPVRFERWIRRYPEVRFVLAHAGGRGEGRHEAIRLARDYDQVYLDLAGDVFCFRLIETLIETLPPNKLIFGSDFPWLDPRCNLTRVLLADIPSAAKLRILQENAVEAYRLPL
jgi:predicted TIM-barrel fold metal-dependent hydrolase